MNAYEIGCTAASAVWRERREVRARTGRTPAAVELSQQTYTDILKVIPGPFVAFRSDVTLLFGIPVEIVDVRGPFHYVRGKLPRWLENHLRYYAS